MTKPSPSTTLTDNLIEQNRPVVRQQKFWPRELFLGLLPLMVGLQIFVWIGYLPIGLHGYADFRTLYVTGYMARTHQGQEIYDADRMLQLKEQFAPLGVTFNQPMDHPAYEALLFVPFSFLSYRNAFWAFILFNVAVLTLAIQLLKPTLNVLSDRWVFAPGFLVASFFPITRAIVQGQDSVILLCLLAGAFLCIQRNKDFAAGLLIGLGLFKLQIVLPIALLFLIWRRWRFVSGFAITSITAAVLSIAVVGAQGARQYLNFTWHELSPYVSGRCVAHLLALTPDNVELERSAIGHFSEQDFALGFARLDCVVLGSGAVSCGSLPPVTAVSDRNGGACQLSPQCAGRQHFADTDRTLSL